ncbi:MAG: type II toxin-antitoxin system VapC family toxin [Roseimicrobium sp.]
MNTYCDANAFVKIYLTMPERADAEAFLNSEPAARTSPLPVTDILRLEVSNAIERMVFESRASGQWRVTPEMAMVAHSDFETDLKVGEWMRLVPLTLADIETEFDTLVRRYTAVHGFRTYDVIHVASALKLRCKRFLSFDAKANALAKLVGLKTAL